MTKRIEKLDNLIKRKFQEIWVSVRKAFLDLDLDRDGYIEPVDIIRYFGDDDPIDILDLNKLMQEKIRDNNKEKSNSNIN